MLTASCLLKLPCSTNYYYISSRSYAITYNFCLCDHESMELFELG